MHNPIPRPDGGDATAKFAVEFEDGCTASGYLFTDGIAPKGYVIPGYAWTGGQIRVKGGGKKSERHPRGRAAWLPAVRTSRTRAGYPAEFAAGRVTVHANAGHGTGEAEAEFDEPGGLLAALEDAMTVAGWTLVAGAQGMAAERAILARALGTAPAPVAALADEPADDIPGLLRKLARTIDDTLGTEPE